MKNSHAYASLGVDELHEHFSNFIIDSWSYSKINTFSRNEKQFEMNYVYRQMGKYSSTTIAGQAYHASLESYFKALKEGIQLDLVSLEQIAFEFINETPANNWKLQKTTPTVDECIEKAVKVVSSLLNNFVGEVNVYLDNISEILEVEYAYASWVSVNGVDIPLPLSFKIDLIIITNEGKRAIIDHKSRNSFTDDEELKLITGKQAITYAIGYESAKNVQIDEVWFIENKYSKNKDGSPQLSLFKIQLDNDTRRLYEALLYEPLKRMIEAISDPDYVYLINDNDNLADRAEMFEFWTQTMIADVEDFNIPEEKKELVAKRLRKIRDASLGNINPTIIKNFKKVASQFINYDFINKDMTASEKIEHVLRSFGKIVKVEHEFSGYSSNTFLLSISAGITIPSIYKHRLDIANALNVNNVRIGKELYVYGGKSYLAIESAKKRDRDLIFDPAKLSGMRIPIGVDNFEQTVVWDLNNHSTPHMLICGATGSGKSVSIASTIKYAKQAGISSIFIFDPKFEFTSLQGDGINVFNDIESIEEKMRELVEFMNHKVKNGLQDKVLIIFDEFSDAVSASKSGNELKVYENIVVGSDKHGMPKYKRECTGTLKSLEENLKILLQKGRSSGFRIIAATQRASTKVITGDAKVNFPVQVCFRVPKEIDSKVVIDESGAESLAGRGDGLIKSPEYSDIVRFQGFFVKN